jgi:hypothetical protein
MIRAARLSLSRLLAEAAWRLSPQRQPLRWELAKALASYDSYRAALAEMKTPSADEGEGAPVPVRSSPSPAAPQGNVIPLPVLVSNILDAGEL